MTQRDDAAERDAEIARLRAEVAEQTALFDRMRAADQRGVDRWRAEKPGRDLIWPDMADATAWLLDQVERADAERDAARALLPAAWEAGRDAAGAECLERAHGYRCGTPSDAVMSAIEECASIAEDIAALRPPPDLAEQLSRETKG